MAPLALMIGPHGSSPPSPYRARTGADTCTGFRAYPMVHITSSAPSMLIALRRKSSLPSPSRPSGRDRPVVVLAAPGHQHGDDARDLVGDRHRGQLELVFDRLALEQRARPQTQGVVMTSAMAKGRAGADHQELAQVAVAHLGDP